MDNETQKTKEQLLANIEELISYGAGDPTIDPKLLKYLEISDLEGIKAKLLEKSGKLSEEDKEWLEQFKKYE